MASDRLATFGAILLMLLSSVVWRGDAKRTTLYAAGFFPVSNKIPEGAIGRGVIPAVELALQHINDSPKVLRGIHLDLVWNDTEVSARRRGVYYLFPTSACARRVFLPHADE